MYVVEIRHDGDGLAEPMAQIRTWLDRERMQPSIFRLSLMVAATIFRLEFRDANDAERFARDFGGQVIGSEGAGSVADESVLPRVENGRLVEQAAREAMEQHREGRGRGGSRVRPRCS